MTEFDPSSRDKLIRAEVEKCTEASMYSVANPYLTPGQKVFVDCWFNVPMALFSLTILTGAVVEPTINTWTLLLWATIGSCLVAIILLLIPNNPLVLPVGFLISGWLGTILCLGLAAYLGYHGRWGYAIYGVLASIGLDSFVSPPMWIYTIFGQRASGLKMHPKYAVAKRVYGIKYPFE